MVFSLSALSSGLPAAAIVDDLCDAVAGGGCAVVHAPPGTGKTTLVPPAVANVVDGEVLVCAPRRVAARAAARRLAQLSGTAVGDVVGYRVRGESRPGSKVTFVTPGVLLRRVVFDPELVGVSAVVVDEVHERHADVDVALGLLVEVATLRDDFALVVMSATVSADRYAALLGGAPVVRAEAEMFPLEVHYRPHGGRVVGSRDFYAHVAATAVEAFSVVQHLDDVGDAGASVLVFVPGVREVEQVASLVRAAGVDAVVLHGGLSAREQDAVVDASAGGRVIVSTSLAESSVTVPGVRGVVDAGLARQPRMDQLRGMQGLVTVSCAQSQAVQRAGRACRQGPGAVWRCYGQGEFLSFPADVTPEVKTADLTQLMLLLAVWGTPRGVGLPLLDEPAPGLVDAAEVSLRALGLVDDAGLVTDVGRRVAGVPADPRLGRALAVWGVGAAGAVAVLADDPKGLVTADGSHPQAGRFARLAARLSSTDPAAAVDGRSLGDDVAHTDAGADTRTDTNTGTGGRAATHGSGKGLSAEWGSVGAGVVAATAFPGRVARRLSGGDGPRAIYQLVQGTRARVDSQTLGGRFPEWLAIVDITRSPHADSANPPKDRDLLLPIIRAAAPLEESQVLECVPPSTTVRAVVDGARVRARSVVSVGAIELSSTPVRPSPEQAATALKQALASEGLARVFPSLDQGPAASLRARLEFAHRVLGEPFVDVGDEALVAAADTVLAHAVAAAAAGEDLSMIDLRGPLLGLIPWQVAHLFDSLVPEVWVAPSGRSVPLVYDGDSVRTSLKLQECFGLQTHPKVGVTSSLPPVEGSPLAPCEGVAVTVELLSPAGRPLAVTGDVPGFFASTYEQVRKEMRGRYPKHPWPEDPFSAPATALTKRRMQS